MKVLRSFLFVLAMGAASISTAQARDSFSIGINVGSHSHHAYPAVSYHVAPQVIYYSAPVVHYRHHVRHAYYQAPAVVYGSSYYDAPRHYNRGQPSHRGNGHNHRSHRGGHH